MTWTGTTHTHKKDAGPHPHPSLIIVSLHEHSFINQRIKTSQHKRRSGEKPGPLLAIQKLLATSNTISCGIHQVKGGQQKRWDRELHPAIRRQPSYVRLNRGLLYPYLAATRLADEDKGILWPYLCKTAPKPLVLAPFLKNRGNKFLYFAANS